MIHGLKEENGGTISTVEFANRLGKVPLLYQPGQSWSYGTSADVVGAVIEVASGMRFGDFLKKEIFEPLGEHVKRRISHIRKHISDPTADVRRKQRTGHDVDIGKVREFFETTRNKMVLSDETVRSPARCCRFAGASL